MTISLKRNEQTRTNLLIYLISKGEASYTPLQKINDHENNKLKKLKYVLFHVITY